MSVVGSESSADGVAYLRRTNQRRSQTFSLASIMTRRWPFFVGPSLSKNEISLRILLGTGGTYFRGTSFVCEISFRESVDCTLGALLVECVLDTSESTGS